MYPLTWIPDRLWWTISFFLNLIMLKIILKQGILLVSLRRISDGIFGVDSYPSAPLKQESKQGISLGSSQSMGSTIFAVAFFSDRFWELEECLGIFCFLLYLFDQR